MAAAQVLLFAFLIGFCGVAVFDRASGDCLGRAFGLAEGAKSSFVDWHSASGHYFHAVGVSGARHG